jgi:archaeosine-15-forming tRNA-guanine transglycosylase
MTTLVYRGGRLVPKSEAPPKGGVFVMSDLKPFVTQDGKEITSRSSLRAYEQANGVKQVGNDFATQTAELRRKVYGANG